MDYGNERLSLRSRGNSPLSERWPLFIAVFALVVGVIGIIAISMVYGLTGGKYPDSYGVVMDAGSSKTDTIVYQWKGNKHRGTGCVSQITNCKAPGGIAEMDPMELDEVINCSKKVTKRIDADSLPLTPLYFAATAGMRLLNMTNPTRANQILDQLKIHLNETLLSVKAIEIISGKDEGIYGWITANFLQKTLEIPQKRDPWVPTTYGALDLGGASTQISFAIPEKDPKKGITLYGQNHNVFSQSNLCFGRDQAELRYRLFLFNQQKPQASNPVLKDPCLAEGPLAVFNITGAKLLLAHCTACKTCPFLDQQKKDPDVLNTTFFFEGTSDPVNCRKNVSLLLNKDHCDSFKFKECFNTGIDNISDVHHENQKFLAFAAFFFTTNTLNLTNADLKTYQTFMEDWCSKDADQVLNSTKDKHAFEACFNVKYIYELLINGYGFNETTWNNIKFVGNIAGKDVGWTLGYMINATNILPEKAQFPRMISSTSLAVCLVIFFLLVLGTLGFIMYMHRDRRR